MNEEVGRALQSVDNGDGKFTNPSIILGESTIEIVTEEETKQRNIVKTLTSQKCTACKANSDGAIKRQKTKTRTVPDSVQIPVGHAIHSFQGTALQLDRSKVFPVFLPRLLLLPQILHLPFGRCSLPRRRASTRKSRLVWQFTYSSNAIDDMADSSSHSL